MRRLYPYRRAIALTKAARRRSAAIYRRLGAERLSFPEAFDEERQRNSFCDRLSVVVKAVGFGKGWWTPGDGLVCSKGNVLRTTRAPQLLSSSTPQPLSSSTPQPLSPSAPQPLSSSGFGSSSSSILPTRNGKSLRCFGSRTACGDVASHIARCMSDNLGDPSWASLSGTCTSHRTTQHFGQNGNRSKREYPR